MTNQEILTKAITKAIENGWDLQRKAVDEYTEPPVDEKFDVGFW